MTGQLSGPGSLLSFESPGCAVQPIGKGKDGLLGFVTPSASLETFYVTIGRNSYS